MKPEKLYKINEVVVEQAISDLESIRDFIRWAFTCFEQADLFYGHGTDNAWDEAVALILQSLSLPFDTPDLEHAGGKGDKPFDLHRFNLQFRWKFWGSASRP